LRAEPGSAARELREFDERFYVQRDVPLSLGQAEALPVPGYCELGGGLEVELHPADGHTPDGMAVWIPWARVLVCGDYLSPVEIPIVEGAPQAYLDTLLRLEALLEQAEHVVAGHGGVLDPVQALAILREDRAYVEALLRDPQAIELPLVRRSPVQRKLHAENLARL
jgi:glyoxylase-like metal-dependent hydrolase (beta-lactamase superfamily II)